MQRDGGGALMISEVRQLLIRAMEKEKADDAASRDPMQIPWVQLD